MTPSATPSFTASPTSTHSPTISPTFTISQTFTPSPIVTPATWLTSIDIFDPKGVLVRRIAGPNSSVPVLNLTLLPTPFDPDLGLLEISQGSWKAWFDGLDDQGIALPNGVYTLVVSSNDGSGAQQVSIQLSVLSDDRDGEGLETARLGPNPVLPGKGQSLHLQWQAGLEIDLRIYNAAGDLIRQLGRLNSGQAQWDLKSASGKEVAAGIYVLSLRIPGERRARLMKLAVIR